MASGQFNEPTGVSGVFDHGMNNPGVRAAGP